MANAPGGHLVYEGFEAWIVMDGQPLPQFGVEYKEGTREGTAWIPSTAGKVRAAGLSCNGVYSAPQASPHADVLRVLSQTTRGR
jgi:hypothetical protein